MNTIWTIIKRELQQYFTTPLAYVFIIIFLILCGVTTFYFGAFYQTGYASLSSFFVFHPWLYLFFIPAITMRLWAEESKSGSIELLLTLPIKTSSIIIGKFLAAWIFIALTLLLTFPIWLTVNYLGNPDNGIIFANYLSSLLMAGAFLAIGSCLSATTNNQVIALITTSAVCLLFVLFGFSRVLDFFSDWAPPWVLNLLSDFSILQHYSNLSRGVIDIRDLSYFVILIFAWLTATAIVIEAKKN